MPAADQKVTSDSDLAPLLPRRWATSSYRQVLVDLVTSGWTPCGIGDWAYGLRSPTGLLAARVSPFDPAYGAFVELCRRVPDNPYLPRIELTCQLDGGGSLVVMEFLLPAGNKEHAALAADWQGGAEAELRTVRREADAVDAEYRERQPWWDGIDFNRGNVRRAIDGRPVLIDIFCLDGWGLYGQVLQDADAVRRLIPADQCRYLLEIPYIARTNTPEGIRALVRAWNG